jgi:hypothetical protein
MAGTRTATLAREYATAHVDADGVRHKLLEVEAE